jgi:phosphotransferase system HPr (HPr) family protein
MDVVESADEAVDQETWALNSLHYFLRGPLANSFRAEIWVDYRGIRGNGKSILDLVGLTAECGATLDLEARGPDAQEALAALADLVAARFHLIDEDGPG